MKLQWKLPVKCKISKEEELVNLLGKYSLIKNIKDNVVEDIKTKKKLEHRLEWIKGDLIKLALKI